MRRETPRQTVDEPRELRVAAEVPDNNGSRTTITETFEWQVDNSQHGTWYSSLPATAYPCSTCPSAKRDGE